MQDPRRYPIGPFVLPAPGDATARLEYVKQLGALPEQVTKEAERLREANLLDTPYRSGGWTGRQVIHHLADSHLHAYRRHKRTLTEDHPTLNPYDEKRWAELADVTAVPVDASLEILRGLHLRLAVLLASCSDTDWSRTCYHPGSGTTYHLDTLAAQYAWHGRHHLGHLSLL